MRVSIHKFNASILFNASIQGLKEAVEIVNWFTQTSRSPVKMGWLACA
jgi:hypothetical protein